MSQLIINLGTADKGNGDVLRTAFTKVNENFAELYNSVSAVVVVGATAPAGSSVGDLWWNSESGRMYVYYGTAWVDASPVDGAGIASTNELVNGAHTVSLGSTGKLTFPNGMVIDPTTYNNQTTFWSGGDAITNGISLTTGEITNSVIIPGTIFADATGVGNTNPLSISGKNGVGITTGADGLAHPQYNWTFGTDGTLTLPDSATLAVGSAAEIDALTLIYIDYRDQLALVFADANYTGDGYPADNTSYARLTESVDPAIQPSWIVLAEAAFDAYDAMLEAQQSISFNIDLYGRQWTFTSNRSEGLNNLLIPENTTINGPRSITLRAEGSGNKEADIVIDSHNNRVSIGTTDGGWTFSNNGILSLPVQGKIENGNFEWAFNETGTLTVPSPSLAGFFLTFASDNYEGTVPKPTLTLTDTPWLVEGQYVYAANGESQLTLGAIGPNLVNPGYESGDTFVFEAYGADDQANHGIKGYTLTITLTSVVEGPSGWTATATESAAPIYPSTILTSGAIKLTNNVDTSWIFGTDGALTFPDSTVQSTAWTNSIAYANVTGTPTIPDIGNVNFIDITMFNPTGIEISNFNLDTLAPATAAISLPANGAGNIVVGVGTGSWTFGADGSLTFPDASVIASYKPVTVIAATTTAQTITDNASAAFIQFVDTVDTASAYSTGTFTAPYTGYYQINMSVYFSTTVSLTSTSFLLIDTNLDFTKQVRIIDGNWTGSYLHYSTVISATAGDAIRIAFRQVSGGDIDVSSGSRLTIHRVSIS